MAPVPDTASAAADDNLIWPVLTFSIGFAGVLLVAAIFACCWGGCSKCVKWRKEKRQRKKREAAERARNDIALRNLEQHRWNSERTR